MKKRLYFDWSGVRGIRVVDDLMPFPKTKEEAEIAKSYDNFDKLIDALGSEKVCLIGECTYESFLPGRRLRVTKKLKKAGHEILVFNPRSTQKFRNGLEKTDAVDAFAIREAAKTLHLKPPTLNPDQVRNETRKIACRLLRIMRNSNVNIEGKKMSTKDYFSNLIIGYLPPLESFDEQTKFALGDGKKKWSQTMIADIGVMVRRVTTPREFEYVVGLHQNGYPNQIRSDLYHWRWARRGFTNPDNKNFGKLTLSQFRKAIRRLFHLERTCVDWNEVDKIIDPIIADIMGDVVEKPEELKEIPMITPEKSNDPIHYGDYLDKLFCE